MILSEFSIDDRLNDLAQDGSEIETIEFSVEPKSDLYMNCLLSIALLDQLSARNINQLSGHPIDNIRLQVRHAYNIALEEIVKKSFGRKYPEKIKDVDEDRLDIRLANYYRFRTFIESLNNAIEHGSVDNNNKSFPVEVEVWQSKVGTMWTVTQHVNGPQLMERYHSIIANPPSPYKAEKYQYKNFSGRTRGNGFARMARPCFPGKLDERCSFKLNDDGGATVGIFKAFVGDWVEII